ncbi:MAG: DUF1467 family protein [Alphaproteobacteria bacterium]|nr:DUF1467 family protein [Alphaproteobacteria bacterium]
MPITAAVIVFAVTWFLVFFVVLPIRFVSQDDAGQIEPGTPAGAPAGAEVARKARITTAITAVLWLGIMAVILTHPFSIRDIDFMGVMGPAPAQN